MEKKIKGIFIAVFIFVIQVLLIPKTGMTWDEPSSFFFGRANLKFWLTGNRAYIEDIKNPELFKDDPFKYIYGEDLYPPLPYLFFSATSMLLSEKLHLMNSIDAHHLGEVIVGAVGVWGMYELSGSAAVTLLFATYPTIFGQMRSDAKDLPLISMIILTMLFFTKWVKTDKLRYAFLAAVFFGFANSVKPSAIILIPIVVLFLWFTNRLKIKTALVGAGMVLVATAIFFLQWPWLWEHTWSRLVRVFLLYKDVGYHMPVLSLGKIYRAGISVPPTYPFGILLFQTPLELIALFLLGLLSLRGPWGALFFIWFFVGMGRFLFDGMIIYQKIRHFIDVMPAFFLIVGYGLQRLPKKIATVLVVFTLIHQAVIIAQLFPYEPGYFNILVGGVKNVAEKGLFDSGHWGAEIKEGMEFVNRQQKQILVYPCTLKHLELFYTAPNVRLTQDPTEATYILVPNAPSWFGGAIDYYKKNHKLVSTVRRGGADFLYIFERTSPTGWNCGRETDMAY